MPSWLLHMPRCYSLAYLCLVHPCESKPTNLPTNEAVLPSLTNTQLAHMFTSGSYSLPGELLKFLHQAHSQNQLSYVPVGVRTYLAQSALQSWPMYLLVNVAALLHTHPLLGCACGCCNMGQTGLFPTPILMCVGKFHGYA